MNREKLALVLDKLSVVQSYLKTCTVNVADWHEPRQILPSYIRINLSIGEATAVEVARKQGDGTEKQHFLRFETITKTRLVRLPDGNQPPPEDVEPEEADTFASILLRIIVEYQVKGDPRELDQEGLAEFTAHNVQFHLWPYYREHVQNLCLRSHLPLPTIPQYRVPLTHQR